MRGSPTTRAWLEVIPRSIADDGCALRSTIAHGIWEVDALEERLHLLIEGSTTDDDFVELSTKGLAHLFADAFLHPAVHHRHVQQESHAIVLHLREHFLANDFLDDEGHGNDDGRLDFGKCLCDDARAWNARKEEHVLTGENLEGELEGHAIHMCQREDADDVWILLKMLTHHLAGKVEVAPQCAIWNHHTLREARGAAGVVDECQLVGTLLVVVVHMLLTEVFRILAAKHLIEVLAGIGEFIGARHQERIVRDVDDALQPRHLRGIDGSGHDITHKEQLGVAVVHDVMHLVGHELMQDGHSHGTIGEHSQIGGGPVGTVASAKGNLVALHHPTVLKHDMQFLNLTCHIMVLQRSSFKIGECIAIPVVDDALLDERVETWYRFHTIGLCCSDIFFDDMLFSYKKTLRCCSDTDSV